MVIFAMLALVFGVIYGLLGKENIFVLSLVSNTDYIL